MLANITGSISLWLLAMFPTLSGPSFLHIFMKSEFSERRLLTVPQVPPPTVFSRNIRALQISMAVLDTFMSQ